MKPLQVLVVLALSLVHMGNCVIKKDCFTYAKDFHPIHELRVTRKSISVVNLEWTGFSIEYCIDKSLAQGEINFIFESSGIPLTIIESGNTHIVYKHDNSIELNDFVFDPVKNITFYTGIKCGNICLRSKVETIELIDGLRRVYTNNYPVTRRTTTRRTRKTTRPARRTTRSTRALTTTENSISVCRDSYGLRRVTVIELNCTHSLVRWDGSNSVSYCKEYFSISNDKVISTLEGSGIMVFLIYGSNVHLVETRTNSLIVHQKYEHVTIYTKIECDEFCVETKPAIVSLKNNTQLFDLSLIERSTTTRRLNQTTTRSTTRALTQHTSSTSLRSISPSRINVCRTLDNILNVNVRKLEGGKVSLRWSAPQIYDYCGTTSNAIDFKGSSIYLNDGSGTLVYVIDGATMYVVRLTSNSFILSPTVSNIRIYTRVRCNSACVDTNHQILNLSGLA